MNPYDPPCAPLLQWSGGLDERDFASYRELAMARSPLRHLVHPNLPVGAGARPAAAESADRDGPPARGRPGKRW